MENRERIIEKIKATAYEKVNEKLKLEQEATEKKLKNDLEKVDACLELIENQMVFKRIKQNGVLRKYVIATEEMFFEDYSKNDKNSWRVGIEFTNKDRNKCEPIFYVNGESYYDVNYMIDNYIHDLDNFSEKCRKLNNEVREKVEQKQHLIAMSKRISELLKSVELFNTDEILNKYLKETEEW